MSSSQIALIFMLLPDSFSLCHRVICDGVLRSVRQVDLSTSVRYWGGTTAVKIAAEVAQPATSVIRIVKGGGAVYGLASVDTSDSMASKIRVQTSSGMKSLRKLE